MFLASFLLLQHEPERKGTPMSLPLQPGTWIIDPAHSTVEFTVRHLGISKAAAGSTPSKQALRSAAT